MVVAGRIRHCEGDLSSHGKVEEPHYHGLRELIQEHLTHLSGGCRSGPLPLAMGVNYLSSREVTFAVYQSNIEDRRPL